MIFKNNEKWCSRWFKRHQWSDWYAPYSQLTKKYNIDTRICLICGLTEERESKKNGGL